MTMAAQFVYNAPDRPAHNASIITRWIFVRHSLVSDKLLLDKSYAMLFM